MCRAQKVHRTRVWSSLVSVGCTTVLLHSRETQKNLNQGRQIECILYANCVVHIVAGRAIVWKSFLFRSLVWRTSVVHIIIIITNYSPSLFASQLAPIKHIPLTKCQRTENRAEILSTAYYIDEIVRPFKLEQHYVPHVFSWRWCCSFCFNFCFEYSLNRMHE